MSKYRMPGLALAVVKNGKVLKLKGYGLASVEFNLPANENTVFQLYSVSKIFAGVAIMKLVEDGKLSLDTPVTDVIGNLPEAWKAIRIRHLLTHTSGLPEWAANPRFAALPEDKRKNLTAEDVIGLVAEMALKFEPGEKFSYGQSSYILLGMIVRKLAGVSYSDFLKQRVFIPLGMSSTQYGGSEVVISRRSSTAYNRETGELRTWLYPFGAKDYPGAGLNASAVDLMNFLIALDSGRVLKPQSLQALWTPVKLNNGTERGYGLGWTVDVHDGRKVVGHEGGGSIWVAHFPAEHLSVIVLCNLNGARADEIQYGVADAVLGK
jgi:CubicO group peptidase (beta-lactamase class C family)